MFNMIGPSTGPNRNTGSNNQVVQRFLSITFIVSHLLNPKQRESIANSHWFLVEEFNKENAVSDMLAGDLPNGIGEEELEIVQKVFDMCFTIVAESVNLAKDEEHSVYDVAKELGPVLFRIISSLNPKE